MSTRGERSGFARVPALDADTAATLLAAPHLPAAALEAAGRVRDAAALATPVLLAVAPASGRLRLARALHAAGGRRGPLLVAHGRLREPTVPDATLLVDLDALGPGDRIVLEALCDDGRTWVLAATADAAAAAPAPWLDALALRVPPLAERAADVPALAQAIVAGKSSRRGGEAPALADDALARLAAHAWPGDVAELDAVLTRALLAAGEGPIAAAHLGLEAVSAPAPEAAEAAEPTEAPATVARLEFLLAEMAHEIKNPLVTIKTFADHLPALLEDAELRERFAALSDEAIARMDGLLENVLDFARLGTPVPESVALGPLLDAQLAEVQPALDARGVLLERHGGPVACRADATHVAYALRNLLAGVMREVPPRDVLRLDLAAPATLRVGFGSGSGAATRLRQLTATNGHGPTFADPTMLPLAFTLARAVVERNGGSLGVASQPGGGTLLELRLPPSPADS
jgi:signal transduction histidine kinase